MFAFAPLCSVLLICREASAGGFSVARFAGEHGHPTTDNATALYYNPGSLTLSSDTHVFTDVNLGFRRVTYERNRQPSDAPDPPDAVGANTGRARVFDFVVVPDLGVTTKLGNLALGIGWFTPFGGPVDWKEREEFRNNPHPGPIDGVSRWHSISGHIITTYFTAGAAYAFGNSGLSLGATLNILYSEIHDLRAWNGGTNDVRTEGRSLLDVNGFGASFGAGLNYEAKRNVLWFGASYQSQPNVTGGMRLEGKLDNHLGSLSTANVDVPYDLPDIVRIGTRYRPDTGVELRLFGDYERWSNLDRHCIVVPGKECNIADNGADLGGGVVLQNIIRDWHDSFEVRAGASVWASRSFEFFAGAGFTSSAVPDATFESGLPDFPYVSLSAGGKKALGSNVQLAISYTQLLFFSRDIESKLHEYVPPTRMPSASGHYTQQIGLLNANLDVQF